MLKFFKLTIILSFKIKFYTLLNKRIADKCKINIYTREKFNNICNKNYSTRNLNIRQIIKENYEKNVFIEY